VTKTLRTHLAERFDEDPTDAYGQPLSGAELVDAAVHAVEAWMRQEFDLCREVGGEWGMARGTVLKELIKEAVK